MQPFGCRVGLISGLRDRISSINPDLFEDSRGYVMSWHEVENYSLYTLLLWKREKEILLKLVKEGVLS
jgi:hypothetical protein